MLRKLLNLFRHKKTDAFFESPVIVRVSGMTEVARIWASQPQYGWMIIRSDGALGFAVSFNKTFNMRVTERITEPRIEVMNANEVELATFDVMGPPVLNPNDFVHLPADGGVSFHATPAGPTARRFG